MPIPKPTKNKPPQVLACNEFVYKTEIKMGSLAWFSWLLTIKSFSFVVGIYRITIRRNTKKPNHWYAFRKRSGKLISRYVGTDKDLTIGTLIDIARFMGIEV
ncbi:hypothetical protein NIES4071_36170 [Calothrix sp. NIES-4071]|nr:hypothetical protein NIES4071_36170 [Calothrix sp. NIES-4071]BAZ57936.1 hypothetical protein NIES4105_36100 [Calothrix sp. NIES-4105]